MNRLFSLHTDMSELIWKNVFSDSLNVIRCRMHSSKPISIYEKRISGYELFAKSHTHTTVKEIQQKWRDLDLSERKYWTSQSYVSETTERYADGTIVKY